MSQTAVSNRYATALFQLAKEQNQLDQLENEFKIVEEVLAGNPQFTTVLNQPKISIVAKKEMMKEVFQGLSTTAVNMLLLLIDKKRINLIDEIIEEYLKLSSDERGVADAKVYSARALTTDEEKALAEAFAKKVGKKDLRITNIVDNTLIGGVKLRIGNTIFDGSVKGKLDRIERQLLSAKS